MNIHEGNGKYVPACEILVLMAHMQKHMLARGLNFDLNTHTDFSSEARSLIFV